MTPAATPPLALIAELTHRCPLHCVYCSNPLELGHRADELSTEVWSRVFREAAEAGVLQLDFTGGEPLARLGALKNDEGRHAYCCTPATGETLGWELCL